MSVWQELNFKKFFTYCKFILRKTCLLIVNILTRLTKGTHHSHPLEWESNGVVVTLKISIWGFSSVSWEQQKVSNDGKMWKALAVSNVCHHIYFILFWLIYFFFMCSLRRNFNNDIFICICLYAGLLIPLLYIQS